MIIGLIEPIYGSLEADGKNILISAIHKEGWTGEKYSSCSSENFLM